MISVLVLTFNEEVNITDCLKSVSFSDDVLVFDSNSTDKTRELALKVGVRVLTRPFDDYGSQRQAALEQGKFKYPWLLVLDADERVDTELAEELKAVSTDPTCAYSGFKIRVKDHFRGRWIPRAVLYPTWHLRFYRHPLAHYEKRAVHEQLSLEGPIGNLKGHLLHYSFNKGKYYWLEKHHQYAKLEAKEGLAAREQPIRWKEMLSKDQKARRKALKSLFFRLPFRGTIRFLYQILVRLAFLEGRPGIQYSWMISRYEYWIHLEIKKLLHENKQARKKRNNLFLGILGIVFIFLFQSFYFYSIFQLNPNTASTYDSVLVYGGSLVRTAEGLRMAEKAKVPIFISEIFGGPQDVKQKMGLTSIPVAVDHFAGTTDQNARNAVTFLKTSGFHKPLLVTSWYHMPRALFLTRLYLIGSGISIEPYSSEPIPSRWWTFPEPWGEMFKFWGSLGRVILAKLGFDKPWFHS